MRANVDNSAQAGTLMHSVHKVVDFIESVKLMGHILVNGQLAKHDFVHQLRYILT